MKSPQKKISIFYFLIMLIITSVILVIYINNIIVVNNLLTSNNDLREEIRKHIQENEMLRADIEKMSSYDRINSLASEKFGLTYKENATENSSIVIKASQTK